MVGGAETEGAGAFVTRARVAEPVGIVSPEEGVLLHTPPGALPPPGLDFLGVIVRRRRRVAPATVAAAAAAAATMVSGEEEVKSTVEKERL